ncbi:PTS sugar transporter subunit IIC [Eupransor demetentiae]|uniref:PTS_EIIC_2 domain (Does not regulate perfringolysin expression) (PfoR) n=1 Tax=Eupransor demetentiae TaxID=3109584 RepID=A0ABP0EQY5_9LACO|nr:Membrane regulatory protein PfoR [Lactobacillaceae bacterium LMG 33000]
MEETAGPRQKNEPKMLYQVSQGISYSILSVLGMGLLLGSLGNMFHVPVLVQAGLMGQKMLAPALGVGIAITMNANLLTTGAALIASTVGSNAVYFTSTAVPATHTATGWAANQAAGSLVLTNGQPVSAILAALVAVLVGNWLSGRTKFDMLLVPLFATLVGTGAGLFLASFTTPFLNWVSEKLAETMQVNPFLGAFVVSVFWLLFMMTPASSAALAIAVALDPLSGGAAMVGTTAGFVMYTAMGWTQNDMGANFSTLVVTPKIQFPNLLKNPMLFVGPALIAGVSAMLAVGFFQLKVPYTIAGLGLNGLIAPIALAAHPTSLLLVAVFGVVLPVVAALVFYRLMRVFGWSKPGDLHLDII